MNKRLLLLTLVLAVGFSFVRHMTTNSQESTQTFKTYMTTTQKI